MRFDKTACSISDLADKTKLLDPDDTAEQLLGSTAQQIRAGILTVSVSVT